MSLQTNLMQIAELSASSYVVDMLPNIVNSDPNFITRNLKRGFMFYVTDELVDQVVVGSSNLTNFSWSGLINAVNKSAFFALASAANEELQLTPLVASQLKRLNVPLADNLATGTLLWFVNSYGTSVENTLSNQINKFL